MSVIMFMMVTAIIKPLTDIIMDQWMVHMMIIITIIVVLHIMK